MDFDLEDLKRILANDDIFPCAYCIAERLSSLALSALPYRTICYVCAVKFGFLVFQK